MSQEKRFEIVCKGRATYLKKEKKKGKQVHPEKNVNDKFHSKSIIIQ